MLPLNQVDQKETEIAVEATWTIAACVDGWIRLTLSLTINGN